VFDRALAASRRLLRSFAAPRTPPSRHVRLRLEELETRSLLSASAAAALTPAPDPSSASSLVAQPNQDASPMTSGSTYYYYTPQQVRQAYGFTQTVLPNGQPATGAGQTIAIVDAYHDPNIRSDLHTFDSGLGLSDPSFQIVSMNSVTQVNSGWASETALDVEWAHAVAPQAKILLVEAASNSYTDLLSAVQYAASQPGVVAVSMSWGGPEFGSETSFDSIFTTPAGHIGGSNLPGGITFVTSSGDSGASSGAQWPAVSPNVLTIGGTSLVLSNGYYGAEAAWSGSGGGYSSYETEPSFQYSVQSSGRRTSPDVAYDANPSTGFLVYNTVGLQSGQSGWWIVGGTSAGAPQWAGIFALADQARAVNGLGSLGAGQTAIYNLSSSDFHDITSGSNGYSAGRGYDLATGRGTPSVNRIVTDLASVPNPQGSTGTSGGPVNGSATRHDDTAALPSSDRALTDLAPSSAGTSTTVPVSSVFPQDSASGDWFLLLSIVGVDAHVPAASADIPEAPQRTEASDDLGSASLGTVYFLPRDLSGSDLAVTTELASHFVKDDGASESLAESD
jgi:subtilase family serine protease